VVTALPPLLPTVRDRFAPLRRPCAPLHPLAPTTLDSPASGEDLADRPPTLDELAAEEGVQDLTVEPDPSAPR
jgi:hypothetical protein